MIGMGLAEAGYLPDWMIRRGIRWMLRNRLRGLEQPDPEAAQLAQLRQLETIFKKVGRVRPRK